MPDLKQIDEALTRYLRPQTFPLAIRMCESEKELPDPHGPGFDAKRLQRKNPEMCAACHGVVTPTR